jgi:hypothetical protein
MIYIKMRLSERNELKTKRNKNTGDYKGRHLE